MCENNLYAYILYKSKNLDAQTNRKNVNVHKWVVLCKQRPGFYHHK